MNVSKKENLGFSKNEIPIKIGFSEGKTAKGYPHFAYHPELELQLFLSGKGKYFIKNRTYLGEKNTALIIHQNEIHRYLSFANSYVKKYTLIFGRRVKMDKPVIAGLLQDLQKTSAILLTDIEAIECRHLMDEIFSEQQKQQDYWKEIILDSVQKILIILKRAQHAEGILLPADNQLVKKVVGFIENNYTYAIKLKDVAEHIHLSKFHLSRTFKKHTGFGFKEYLIQFRIAKARETLLQHENLKISAIAYRVGFGEISSFNQQFKKLTGYTPSSYRKLFLKTKLETNRKKT